MPESGHTAAFGGGIAGAVIAQLGIDPAQLGRILNNTEAITADVRSITDRAAAFVNSLPSPPAKTQGLHAMSTASDPSDNVPSLSIEHQSLLRAHIISAARQQGGIRAGLAMRVAFRSSDFSDQVFASAAAQAAAEGVAVDAAGVTTDAVTPPTPAPGAPTPKPRPFLHWLMNGGLQWILNIVTMLLPLFGGPAIPPIVIPPAPKPPAIPAVASHAKTEFALPVVPAWLLAMLADFGQAELQFLEDYISGKLQSAA